MRALLRFLLAAVWPGPKVALLLLLSALVCALATPAALPFFPASELGPRWALSLLALIGPAPLMLAVQGASPQRSYWLGCLSFAAQSALLFHWLAVPVAVFGKLGWAAGVGAVIGVACLCAAIFACIPLLARVAEQHAGFPSWLAWPAAWTAVEMIRAVFPFGGFPWGGLGAALTGNLVVLQLASLFGVYGLTFVAVATSALLAEAWQRWRMGQKGVWLRLATVVFGAGLLVLYGAWRLSWLEGQQVAAPKLRVAILQGNIDQEMKNKAEQHRATILAKYSELTRQAVAEGAKLVVWPEAAYPGFFERSSRTLAGRGFGEPTTDVFTAAGVVFYWREASGDLRQVKLHNSMVVLDPNFDVVEAYHKRHLVPFGERVPWPLSGVLKRLVPGVGAFEPGPVTAPVTVHGARVAGLICYEGIFPRYSREFARAGANLLVNVTNDAWYGYTSAPHQHVAFYALRAVETGRSVVRAANTGVSAFYGPDGRAHGSSRLFQDAVVVHDVPLLERGTLYLLVGDSLGWLSLALVLGSAGAAVLRRRRKDSNSLAQGSS